METEQSTSIVIENNYNHHSQEDLPKIDSQPNVKLSDYANFSKLALLSVCFLGIYIALYSAQNVQSVLFEDDGFGNLGFYSNGIDYLAQALGSLFSVYILEKHGNVKSISVSSLLGMPFIFCMIFPALKSMFPDSTIFLFSKPFVFTVIILSSVSNGFAMGIAQPGAGTYVSKCATENTKGFYFAYFWAFYMGSQVFGNLLAAYILGSIAQVWYVLIMLFIGVVSAIFLIKLKEPVEIHPRVIVEGEHIHEYTSFVGPQVTLKVVLLQMWRLFATKRFLILAPQFLWCGISIAYFSGLLVEVMSNAIGEKAKKDKYQMSMLAMVAFGVGQILGGFFIGFIVDKFGSKIAGVINVFLVITTASVSVSFIAFNEFTSLAYIMAFMWGFEDSSINTHSQEMLGFEFNRSSEPFAVFNIIQSLACFIFSIVETQTVTQTDQIVYTSLIGVFGAISCGLPVFFFKFKELKSSKVFFSIKSDGFKNSDDQVLIKKEEKRDA